MASRKIQKPSKPLYRLEYRHGSIYAFDSIPLPSEADLTFSRYGNGYTTGLLASRENFLAESNRQADIVFRDQASGKQLSGSLQPGRAALLLVLEDGSLAASYNWSNRWSLIGTFNDGAIKGWFRGLVVPRSWREAARLPYCRGPFAKPFGALRQPLAIGLHRLKRRQDSQGLGRT